MFLPSLLFPILSVALYISPFLLIKYTFLYSQPFSSSHWCVCVGLLLSKFDTSTISAECATASLLLLSVFLASLSITLCGLFAPSFFTLSLSLANSITLSLLFSSKTVICSVMFSFTPEESSRPTS